MTEFNGLFDKLYASIYEKLQGPEAIEWFSTYYCNSHCQYCGGYDRETRNEFKGVIPYKKIIRIVKESNMAGTAVWNIGGRGGEPLLYPNLTGVLREIKRNNMRGILITNGLLLGDKFLINLVDMQWDILRVSLDSSFSHIHDEIRGVPGNFDKINRALILLNNLKKEKVVRSPSVICCPVLTNKNYKYVSEYIDYCIERAVNEIQFMPLIDVHERANSLMLSSAGKQECIDLLRERMDEQRIKHNIGFMVSLLRESSDTKKDAACEYNRDNLLYCIHLWKTFVISEDGYVSPCSLIKDKLLKINGSYLKLWDSKEMNVLRAKVLSGEPISPACSDCCGPLRNETYDFNQYLIKRNFK